MTRTIEAIQMYPKMHRLLQDLHCVPKNSFQNGTTNTREWKRSCCTTGSRGVQFEQVNKKTSYLSKCNHAFRFPRKTSSAIHLCKFVTVRHNFLESYRRLSTGDSEDLSHVLGNHCLAWRQTQLTPESHHTMRPSTGCCPSLSSGLAEMTRKYSVLWEISVIVKHLIKKASPALLN